MTPLPVVAIANQKGGVGKTTTAVNLGAALALSGQRTLIIDLDPQGNASTGLDIARSQRSPGAYRWLARHEQLAASTRPTAISGLSIIPSEADLAGLELESVNTDRREHLLQDALAHTDRDTVVLIDCPPSLGLLTLNGLVAASSILVPLQCEFFALEGLSQLAQTVDRVRQRLNPHARIDGILLTMYDRRNRLSELIATDARSFFGDRVYREVIPRSVRVSEAPSHGKPVVMYDPKSPGALSYSRFALEFSARFNLPAQAAAA